MPTPEDDPLALDQLPGEKVADDSQVDAWLDRVDAFLCPHFDQSTDELSDTQRAPANVRPAPPEPEPASLSIPAYEITGKLAEGGMGRI